MTPRVSRSYLHHLWKRIFVRCLVIRLPRHARLANSSLAVRRLQALTRWSLTAAVPSTPVALRPWQKAPARAAWPSNRIDGKVNHSGYCSSRATASRRRTCRRRASWPSGHRHRPCFLSHTKKTWNARPLAGRSAFSAPIRLRPEYRYPSAVARWANRATPYLAGTRTGRSCPRRSRWPGSPGRRPRRAEAARDRRGTSGTAP